MAFFLRGARGQPCSIVLNRKLEKIAVAPRCNYQPAGVGAPRDPMTQRILDKLLKGEAGHGGSQQRLVYVELRPQPVRESLVLDGDIAADQVELFAQRDFARAMPAQRAPQQLAELFD